MNEKAIPIILGVGVTGLLVFALTRKAKAVSCMNLAPPDVFHYLTYVGSRQTFKKALGECWSVINVIQVYDPETDDYWAPPDPVHDILETGSKCRIKVQAPCRLCGFGYE